MANGCHPATASGFARTVATSRFTISICRHHVAAIACASGIALLLLNCLGFVIPLRAADVDGYRDFAGGETLPFKVALERLERLAAGHLSKAELVTRATLVIHQGMAHLAKTDVARHGVAHYRLRVPASENWILFALSYIKPTTYRRYEFCRYAKALERGTGQCGQQSMALVSFLSAQGLETGFVGLGGLHEIATAKVDDSSWYLLDPDYGGVMPFGVTAARRNPTSVLPHYWSDAARERRIDQVYGAESSVRYGGPEARYARACRIEELAYALKWFVPALLIGGGLGSVLSFGQTTRLS